jgi:hypothetical protein
MTRLDHGISGVRRVAKGPESIRRSHPATFGRAIRGACIRRQSIPSNEGVQEYPLL